MWLAGGCSTARSRPATSPSASTSPRSSPPPRHDRPCSRGGRRGAGVRRGADPAALPALQTVALSSDTRRRVRKDKKLLGLVREGLVALRPSAAETAADRAAPHHAAHAAHDRRGHIAGYVLLSQLAQVDLVGLVRLADLRWVLVALVLVVPDVRRRLAVALGLRAGEAVARTARSPPSSPPLRHARVAAHGRRGRDQRALPAALGPAPRPRRGQRRRVPGVRVRPAHRDAVHRRHPGRHQQPDRAPTPPAWAVWAVVGVVVALALLLLFGPVRKILVDRVRPIFNEVGPRLSPWPSSPGRSSRAWAASCC